MVSSPIFSPWFADAAFILCPRLVSPPGGRIPGGSLCVQISSPSKGTSKIGLWPTVRASFQSPLQRSYFQIHSHSEVLGVRASACEFGRWGTIQPTTASSQFLLVFTVLRSGGHSVELAPPTGVLGAISLGTACSEPEQAASLLVPEWVG